MTSLSQQVLSVNLLSDKPAMTIVLGRRLRHCITLILLFSVAHVVTASSFEEKLAKFHFDQGQYRQALLWLAEQEDSALKARTLVKLGLFDEASLVFEHLDKIQHQGATDRFWLNQAAREFYSAQYGLASKSLARISGQLTPLLQPQYNYLNARLALLDNDLKTFDRYRHQLTLKSALADYLSHHWLLHKIKHKTLTKSDLTQYVHLGGVPSPAMQSLAERTYVAMGLAYIDMGEQRAAIRAFEQIRLTSPFLKEALRGYGWALINTGQYARAHQMFTMLAQHNPTFYFEQDVVRGYAFAKQKLEDFAGAYQLLERGISAYALEHDNLISLQSRFRVDGSCLSAFVGANELTDCHTPTSHLMPLLASNKIAQIAEQLRTVDELSSDYHDKLVDIDMHHARLLERQTRVNQRVAQQPMEQVITLIDEVTVQRNILAALIAQAKASKDSHFFLAEKYLKQQAYLNQLYQEVVLLKRAGLKNDGSERRVEFMQRALWWHSKSNFISNSKTTENELAQLDDLLALLRTMHKNFVEYVAMVNNIDSALTHLAKLKLQYQQQQQQAKEVKTQLTSNLAQHFISHLEQRISALKQAELQTKLSRLKLLDFNYQQKFDFDNEGGIKR